MVYLIIAVACFFAGFYFGKDSVKGTVLSESETEAIRQVLNVLSWTGGNDENKNQS
jgi:hypothetical protein